MYTALTLLHNIILRVGAGIYVEVGDGSVPLGALPNNGLMIALSIMATVRLQYVCRSTSNSSGVGQLIGPVTSPDQLFNISTLQAGTLEVVNDGAFPSLTSMDQGIYTCQIPDSVGTMVDINVGIYPNGFNSKCRQLDLLHNFCSASRYNSMRTIL